MYSHDEQSRRLNWGVGVLLLVMTLLLYGMLWLHFDLSLLQISLIVGTALLTQYAGTRLYQPCAS